MYSCETGGYKSTSWSNGITQRTKDDKYEHTEKVSSFYSV